MPQRGGYDCLRIIDRFAKPITLKLNRQQYFGTPMGGVFTLLIGLAAFAYGLDVFIFNFGRFQKTLTETSINFKDASDAYNLTNERFIFAFNLVDMSDYLPNLDKHFSVVYQNSVWDPDHLNLTTTIVPLVDCNSLEFPEDSIITKDQQEWFKSDTIGMKCLLQDNQQNILLQGFTPFGSYKLPKTKQSYNNFVYAACADLTNYTNQTDCVPYEESVEKLQDMQLTMLTYSLQPSTEEIGAKSFNKTFLKQKLYPSGFVQNQTQLTMFGVQVVKAAYYMDWFLNLGKNLTYTYFAETNAHTSLIGQNAGSSITLKKINRPLVIFYITLDQSISHLKLERITICEQIGFVGGMMFTLIALGKELNDKFADFAIDNMLMRKFYSVEKSDDPIFEKKNFPESEFTHPGYFYEYMNKLTSFYYTGFRWCKRSWCHWRCCCCKQCQDEGADRIFDKASLRLDKEIDLVEIVKQLRISAFLNQLSFRQFQVDIIPLFNHYRISDRHTQFDNMAEHPGQFLEDVIPTTRQDAATEAYDEAVIRKLQKKRKITAYRDCLQAISKMQLEQDLQTKLNIDGDPTDKQILKNVLGEDYDHEKREEIYKDIIDPPNFITVDENNRPMDESQRLSSTDTWIPLIQ